MELIYPNHSKQSSPDQQYRTCQWCYNVHYHTCKHLKIMHFPLKMLFFFKF